MNQPSSSEPTSPPPSPSEHGHTGHGHGHDEQPDPIKDRMDQLLDQCIQKAVGLIGEHGEFYPFAITRNDQGQMNATQARLVEEQPSVALVTETLLRGLANEANQGYYTTVAIVSDVRLREPGTGLYTDAVRVAIEDRQADPVDFFMPYEREGQKIVTRDLVAQESRSIIFPDANEATD